MENELATPEYVIDRIGPTDDPYMEAVKALAESVESAVPGYQMNRANIPEDIATVGEIADRVGTTEWILKQELLDAWVMRGMVYREGDCYVLKRRSINHVDLVVDRYADADWGWHREALIRANAWLWRAERTLG